MGHLWGDDTAADEVDVIMQKDAEKNADAESDDEDDSGGEGQDDPG